MDGVYYTPGRPEYCLNDIFEKNHRNITPETLFRDVAGYMKTGDC